MPQAPKRFSLDDTALILIDHQVGMQGWSVSTSLALLQRNLLILARFAAGTHLPVVLTSSHEAAPHAHGPILPQLQEVLPEAFATRVKRTGIVNAWDDPAFADACRKTGRYNLVMAGATTDVCVVGPALSAVAEGYDVQVVADACGSSTQLAEDMSYRRMEFGGVRLTSTHAIVAELVRHWATPAGVLALSLLG